MAQVSCSPGLDSKDIPIAGRLPCGSPVGPRVPGTPELPCFWESFSSGHLDGAAEDGQSFTRLLVSLLCPACIIKFLEGLT